QVDMLDVLTGHRDDDVAEPERLRHQYARWCLTISKTARVASRSRSRIGNRAFSTWASRAWSPRQPAGALSRTARSICNARLAFSSGSTGLLKAAPGIEARLLNNTLAS